MKKIREELVEYFYDSESGQVQRKTKESVLVSEKDGRERWVTTNRTIPLV